MKSISVSQWCHIDITIIPHDLYYLQVEVMQVEEKNVSFTLRIPVEIVQKLDYIAAYNGRSRSSEINWLIRRHIAEFEKENGPITEGEYKGI